MYMYISTLSTKSIVCALKQCDNLYDKILGIAFVICKFLYITPKMNTLVYRAIMEQDMHKPNSLVIAL